MLKIGSILLILLAGCTNNLQETTCDNGLVYLHSGVDDDFCETRMMWRKENF